LLGRPGAPGTQGLPVHLATYRGESPGGGELDGSGSVGVEKTPEQLGAVAVMEPPKAFGGGTDQGGTLGTGFRLEGGHEEWDRFGVQELSQVSQGAETDDGIGGPLGYPSQSLARPSVGESLDIFPCQPSLDAAGEGVEQSPSYGLHG
jgi:hypothetical protein